uniref:BZIP domain-containing protein n=1 Tax=Panagrellus redivivus TaxID=6233 RepID=A0A7E4W1W9_PANRE
MSVKMENGAAMPGDAPVSSQSTPVLITQAIPTSSHIVLTQNDDENPVYVQYVIPSESTIISSPSDTPNDDPNQIASILDTIDSTVTAVSNTQRPLSPMPNAFGTTPTVVLKFNSTRSRNREDDDKKSVKKQRQAEAARLRYHRLDAEEKKALNLKRTQAQRRKRQREKEMQELEALLRESNDIVDDPEVTSQLREKRLRARWAEAARSRYQRMSEEERRAHNVKRRMRQLTVKNENGDIMEDTGANVKVKEQNSKKALAARTRYHRMSNEEKKAYNQKRTEAFRRRRLEEEALLAMPIGRINGEALDRAQQIVVRNAKRAEAARLRYQRMTPDERRLYNQKRYTPKKRRETYLSKIRKNNDAEPSPASSDGQINLDDMACLGQDSLSSLERDVMRRTQHAQQIIRERGLAAPNAINVTRTKPEFTSFPGIASVPGGPKRTVIKAKKPSSLANTIVVRPPPPLPTQHTAELA